MNSSPCLGSLFVLTATRKKQIDFFADYLDQILVNQIVAFAPHEKESIMATTRIRLEKIEQGDYESVEDLLEEDPLPVRFDLHEDAVNFLRRKHLSDVNDDATLQDIYMSVSRFGLLRERVAEKDRQA